ncbi:MAG: single-stranded-DNA-specific exonuclease RecJ [Gammaproteobacteria bacterium]
MNTTIVRRQCAQLPELPVSPLLRKIYAHRNISHPDELDKTLARMPRPDLFKGMEAALDLLQDALEQQHKIVIVADFDADGATSCAVAIRGLQAMGAQQVDFVVPDRFKFGYGLTPEIVQVAAAKQPALLITVDNGISSLDGVAAARELGIKVLITDHHLPADALPDASAIVNPNQPGCDFPSKNLAGVGVIFYVLTALRARLRGCGWFHDRPEPNLGQLLDLVAFGTVADVVALDQVNRILVEHGLKRVRAGKGCAGINALCEVARRNPDTLVASDIAFALGPRLNAAGRLEDMSYGIRCLLCDDPRQARSMAWELDRLNHERRDIESEMLHHALDDLDTKLSAAGVLPFGLCLFDESWHQGVVGILASRIKERTHRPVIAFALESDTATRLKGSARSVAGVHIRDALDAVASRHPGLIDKFGGHAMAAGLSLEREKFDAFRAAFDSEVRRHLNPDDLQGILHSDGELSPAELCLPLAEELRQAGPWGQGFPEPLFDGIFEVISHKVLAEKHLKMVLAPPGSQHLVDAIAFNKAPLPQPADGHSGDPHTRQQVRIAYRLDVNEWRGQRSAQLIVEHIETV